LSESTVVSIHRILHHYQKGTVGVLLINDLYCCLTLEPPWRQNERNRSCIPPGRYQLIPHESSRFGNVWLVDDVPGRTGILIHAGNRVEDTDGCILPGIYQSPENPFEIRKSQAGMDQIEATLWGNEATLTIMGP